MNYGSCNSFEGFIGKNYEGNPLNISLTWMYFRPTLLDLSVKLETYVLQILIYSNEKKGSSFGSLFILDRIHVYIYICMYIFTYIYIYTYIYIDRCIFFFKK